MMQLATSDDRDPLTATIAAAKRVNHPGCDKWRDDLTIMTAELSAKFFGTRNVEMIRAGLGMAVKLVGMGLLERSQGAPDLDLWTISLTQMGIKGVTSTAVERIKLVASLPEAPVLAGQQETEPRTLLMLCASCGDAKEAWNWLEMHARSRREYLSSIRLAKWLLSQTPSGRVKDRNLRQSDGLDMHLADEIIDEVVANICGLPRGEEEFIAMEPCKLAPAKFREARTAYDALAARLDPGLRQALSYEGREWFDRYVFEKKPGKPAGTKSRSKETAS